MYTRNRVFVFHMATATFGIWIQNFWIWLFIVDPVVSSMVLYPGNSGSCLVTRHYHPSIPSFQYAKKITNVATTIRKCSTKWMDVLKMMLRKFSVFPSFSIHKVIQVSSIFTGVTVSFTIDPKSSERNVPNVAWEGSHHWMVADFGRDRSLRALALWVSRHVDNLGCRQLRWKWCLSCFFDLEGWRLVETY